MRLAGTVVASSVVEWAVAFVWLTVILAAVIFVHVAYWKIFVAAGQPGVLALVPVVNVFVAVNIARRPLWHGILLFVPIVNIVMAVLVGIDIAKRFDKGSAFGVGLGLLPFIVAPVLAFGSIRTQPGVGRTL